MLRRFLPQKAWLRALMFLVIGLLLYIPAKSSSIRLQPKADLTIGSKNFTESKLLAEMYALTLEKAGYRVHRRFNLGGTFIAHEALKKGEIDLYPEYTGTGLLNILNHSQENDEKQALEILNRDYHRRWGLCWLTPAEANNSQGLVTLKRTAEQYNLYTISRLSAVAPRLRLAAIPEFFDRQDGLQGLRKHYGSLAFKRIRQYDNGLKYRLLLNGEADVTVGFSTDGELSDPRFVLLQDDRSFWPVYRVAPVVREQVLRQMPLVKGVLNRLSSVISTPVLRGLNEQIDIKHQDYRQVARTFLKEKGIL